MADKEKIADQRRARRKRHFENGGDLGTYRRRPAKFVDRKKKADKERCRKGGEEE